jgi:hypothetical protein
VSGKETPVPTRTLPNAMFVGTTLTGEIPVPVRAIDCGLPKALKEIFRVEARAPRADGENVMEMLQLSPAPNVFGLIGQLLLQP